LTRREKIFCWVYSGAGNAREAAAAAGFIKDPENKAELLLSREDVRREVDECVRRRKSDLESKAILGYERLAFGSVADAVRLMFIEQPDARQLEEMDFFQISEIKRPKDGSMEIKFFDRHKALDKLLECGRGQDTGLSVYTALENSAASLEDSGFEG